MECKSRFKPWGWRSSFPRQWHVRAGLLAGPLEAPAAAREVEWAVEWAVAPEVPEVALVAAPEEGVAQDFHSSRLL